ncbi:MAG TPA: 1-deoxy-D-xylulose-5-phosphate reductoisomerase [Chitinivibrionales bacterium]|nr:1-deoxy-D-xylulose-5-phosphate reductoisomerase [Chitinivibrionales bacterium]
MGQAKIIILGATGSIGMSACACIRRFPDRFRVAAMSANNNIDKLAALVKEFRPAAVCFGASEKAAALKGIMPKEVRVFTGVKGLEELVEQADFDILCNALVGAVGLRPTVAALKRNKRVALANKESLVIGGDYITSLLHQKKGELVPVDSEHSAILQCLAGSERDGVESVILTASGGPFREQPLDTFKDITPKDALNHPTWNMGKKITIDAATLVNKGFELIEAHHLFAMPYEKLRVVIHPQSVVHSMVEFHDGAIIAQMGVPDMELPIQLALSYPERLPLAGKRLDLAKLRALTFFEPDFTRFPCLKLCIDAGKTGGTMPAALNAANEVAVQAFLDNKIGFNRIAELIQGACDDHKPVPVDGVETVEKVDRETREKTRARIRE